MKYKAIIFDMDGTIVDTTPVWLKASQKLIETQGIAYTPELHAQLLPKIHGLTLTNVCSVIKKELNLSCPLDQLAKEKSQIAMDLYTQGITFMRGFEDFFKTLSPLNLSHAIATNADPTTIQKTEKALNLSRYFGKHIYGISCVNNKGKPDPAIYLHAAKQLGIRPEECIAIEDSAFGIKSAQNAGMFCVGVNICSTNFEQVKNADLIVNNYHDLDIKKLLK